MFSICPIEWGPILFRKIYLSFFSVLCLNFQTDYFLDEGSTNSEDKVGLK